MRKRTPKSRPESSIYLKLVEEFNFVFSQFYLSPDTPIDLTPIKKILEKEKSKKESHFYPQILQFYNDLLNLNIEIGADADHRAFDPFILTGKAVEKYKQLLKEIEGIVFSNSEVLAAWKCLEATNLRCTKDENPLLTAKKKAYSESQNPNKKKALDLFNSIPHIIHYGDLEEKSIVSAVVAAIKQTNTGKVKKSIIQPMLQVAHTALLTINSFSQWLPFYLLTRQAVNARPVERGRSVSPSNNCVTESQKSIFNLNVYQEDLNKNRNFLQVLHKEQSIEFGFNDTYYILRVDSLERQDLGRNKKVFYNADYYWFLSAMAIYLVERKVEKIGGELGLGGKNEVYPKLTREILEIDEEFYNNRKLLTISSRVISLEDSVDTGFQEFVFRSQCLATRTQIHVFMRDRFIFSLENENVIRKKITAYKSNLTIQNRVATNALTVSSTRYDRHLFFPGISSLSPETLSVTDQTTFSNREDGSNLTWIVPVVPAVAVPILFVVGITTFFAVRYIKKPKTNNNLTNTELVPLVHSLENQDPLHISVLMSRLNKRLDYLKKRQERYQDEIGFIYDKICGEKNRTEVIACLKKLREQLDKYSKEKNKPQYNAAEVIIDSLIQRYRLLSLPASHQLNKANYLTEQLKSGLKKLVYTMLNTIESLRDDFEKDNFARKISKNKTKFYYFDLLIRLEKAIYETMLSAHAEGYFEKYSRSKVMGCLEDKEDNLEDSNFDVKIRRDDLQSSINFTLSPVEEMFEELTKLKRGDESLQSLSEPIKGCKIQLNSMKSQLIAYCSYENGISVGRSKAQEDSRNASVKPL